MLLNILYTLRMLILETSSRVLQMLEVPKHLSLISNSKRNYLNLNIRGNLYLTQEKAASSWAKEKGFMAFQVFILPWLDTTLRAMLHCSHAEPSETLGSCDARDVVRVVVVDVLCPRGVSDCTTVTLPCPEWVSNFGLSLVAILACKLKNCYNSVSLRTMVAMKRTRFGAPALSCRSGTTSVSIVGGEVLHALLNSGLQPKRWGCLVGPVGPHYVTLLMWRSRVSAVPQCELCKNDKPIRSSLWPLLDFAAPSRLLCSWTRPWPWVSIAAA